MGDCGGLTENAVDAIAVVLEVAQVVAVLPQPFDGDSARRDRERAGMAWGGAAILIEDFEGELGNHAVASVIGEQDVAQGALGDGHDVDVVPCDLAPVEDVLVEVGTGKAVEGGRGGLADGGEQTEVAVAAVIDRVRSRGPRNGTGLARARSDRTDGLRGGDSAAHLRN